MKINGTWKSSSGSTLTINENQGEISGTYQLSSDKAQIKHKINGSIDPDETPEVRPLSFSVAWTDEAGKSAHSVTAYTGQFNAKKATPELEVIFLIANDKTPLWNGTGISYETFTQEVEVPVTTIKPAASAAVATLAGAVTTATVVTAASETVEAATDTAATPLQAVSVAGAADRSKAFSDIDIDSSGVIGFPEWYHHFKPLLKETNMEMSELKMMFSAYDADGSKGIDVNEYTSLMNDVFGAVAEGDASASEESGVANTLVGAVTTATVVAAAADSTAAAPAQAVSVAGAAERSKAFSDIDIDSSGVIGFPEWYHHFKPLLKETNMEMDELRIMFSAYDADGSKGIDVNEYTSLMNDVFGAVAEGETTTTAAAAPMQAVSVSGAAERSKAFSDIDIDSSGVIGFPEWYHHFKPLLKETNMEMDELRIMFRVYDADGSKGLDVNEYTLLMNDVFGVAVTDSMKEPATDRAEAFLAIDTDGSSIINFPEWYNYYQSWIKRTTLTGGELLAMFNAYDEAGSTRGIDYAEYCAFMEDVFGPQ